MVQFLIPRFEGGHVTDIAIVSAHVGKKEHEDITNFKNALIAVIDKWIRTTKSGHKALQDSSWDFNVGDLALWDEDKELEKLLKEERIYDLSVNIPEVKSDSAGNWLFDTLLFTEIPKDENGDIVYAE